MNANTDGKNPEAQIRGLRDELTSALKAKDAQRLVSCFTDDSVLFLLAPPLRVEGDGLGRSGLQEWFDSFRGPIGYEVRELDVAAGGDVAFCHSLNRIVGTRRDGSETDIWVRETLGLRRVGGEWRVAHQHQSVPFHMDGSDRAAVDLEP